MRDFTTDTVPRPLIAAGLAGTLPEWALSSPIPTSDTLAEKSASAFADPVHRLLPLIDRSTVLCSGVYFAAYPGIYPEGTGERIKAAATALGVTAELELILASEQTKEAAAPLIEKAAFALQLEDGAVFGLAPGPQNYLPCHDSFTIDRSAEELAKSAASGSLPPEFVYIAAVELTKAAAARHCSDVLPPVVQQLGTERMADWSKAQVLVQDRLKHAGAAGMTGYTELLKLGAEHPEHASAVIDGLRDLDASHGLSYWQKAGSVLSPWQVVYCGPTHAEIEKMAASHVVLAGALVPQMVLSALPAARIDQQFSKAAAAIIKSAQATLNTQDATAALTGLEGDLQVRLFHTLTGL